MGPMALSENRLPQIAIDSVVDHPFPNGNGEPGHSPFQRPSPRCCPPWFGGSRWRRWPWHSPGWYRGRGNALAGINHGSWGDFMVMKWWFHGLMVTYWDLSRNWIWWESHTSFPHLYSYSTPRNHSWIGHVFAYLAPLSGCLIWSDDGIENGHHLHSIHRLRSNPCNYGYYML